MRIDELTRIERYYRDNPDRLPRHNLSPPKSKDDPGDRFSSEDQQRIRAAKEAFVEKWQSAFGRELFKKLAPYGADIAYHTEDSIEYARGNVNKFVSKFEERHTLNDNEKQKIALYYSNFVGSVAKLKKITDAIGKASYNRARKQATRSNLRNSDYQAIKAWIEHYTSMSRKTIPQEIWPALQRLTVIPARLPKTVYRGLFFDGAKIKDREKWLKQWAPGNKPNVKPTKIQSWSTSIGVATQFMSAQDFVKDQKTGFAVLLKYDITDPDIVIADFRNLKDSGYWNQQEIVLAPGARDYEVVAAIPAEDYYAQGKKWNETDLYQYQEKNAAPGAGAAGMDRKTMFVHMMFDLNRMQIDAAEKQQLRQATKLTVGEAKKKFGFKGRFLDDIEQSFDNTLMPLYALVSTPNSTINSDWEIVIERATGKNTVDATIGFDPSWGLGKADPVFQDLFGEKPAYGEKLILPVTITLSNTDYNAFRFDIDPSGRFFIGRVDSFSKETKPSDSESNQRLQSSQKLQRQLMGNLQSALSNYKKKNVSLNLKQ